MSSKYEYPPPDTLWNGLASFHWRSNVNSTSSALKSRVGVKSLLDCHFTPCRRWKVMVLPSGEMSQLSASDGSVCVVPSLNATSRW